MSKPLREPIAIERATSRLCGYDRSIMILEVKNHPIDGHAAPAMVVLVVIHTITCSMRIEMA